MKEPKAQEQPKRFQHHGIERVDNYYWLKERENTSVLDYLHAENEYTISELASTEYLKKILFDEMVQRLQPDESTVPYKEGDFYYYKRFESGKEYPVYARKKYTLTSEEEVTLDVNELAEGNAYCHVIGYSISSDHARLAYAMDTQGRRIYDLYIRRLNSNKIWDEKIEYVTGNIVWAEDGLTLYYTRQHPETLRPFQLFRHSLGTDSSQDKLLYEESDETYHIGVHKSKSKEFIFLAIESTLSSEVHYVSAASVSSSFKLFHPRESRHEYTVDHIKNHFYIITNWQAQNFRLMRAIEGKTYKADWEEVIPHRTDIYLEDIELFNDFLVVQERFEGLASIRFRFWEEQVFKSLPFPDTVYFSYIDYNPSPNTSKLRIQYQSLHTPPSVYEYHMEEQKLELLKEKKILGGFRKENYVVKRIHIPARDGIQVPVSLVYRKEIEPSRDTALLLYAYGSYGISMEAYFSSARVSLLDRGFIFAIAHVRGGSELGRAWYEGGKLLKKKNTFFDFIDCAKYLVEQEYTSSSNLYAMGGSAGGLLMGAVMNMEPALFNGIVASVPFVDVVTTMLDDSIPLTTGEYDEWGNPNEKAFFEYMLSYSPYDQVTPTDYPHLLVMAGLHDSQVQYWEPAKWVAKIRKLRTNNRLLLLHTNMEAGHSGPSGRYQPYKEIALEYAFLLQLEYHLSEEE